MLLIGEGGISLRRDRGGCRLDVDIAAKRAQRAISDRWRRNRSGPRPPAAVRGTEPQRDTWAAEPPSALWRPGWISLESPTFSEFLRRGYGNTTVL
ncbi:hypothetical protein GCM10027563_24080 [Parasphingorhabdus pacifica]